ncbi:MAG: 2-phospho-L-lactate guanylyltransferase [Saccharofermentanales bacterium]|jgi:2-phospho-L-lactate guanylyltransferase
MSSRERKNRVCACIPFKNLKSCKTRLRDTLSQQQVEQLMIGLLCGVSSALLNCPIIEEVWLFTADKEVVSKDPIFKDVHLIEDAEKLDLNDSFARAAQLASNEDFTGMLFIHGDIPFLCSKELDQIISSWNGETVLLFSDKNFSGTNAILTPLPAAISTMFGKNSLKRHVAMLIDSDHDFEILYYRSIAIDIDEVSDLNYLYSPCGYGNLLSRWKA